MTDKTFVIVNLSNCSELVRPAYTSVFQKNFRQECRRFYNLTYVRMCSKGRISLLIVTSEDETLKNPIG